MIATAAAAAAITPYTSLSADQSAMLFSDLIRSRVNFAYIRYGDGALECMNGGGAGRTRDGEVYSLALSVELLTAWDRFMCLPNVFVGDWLSASFDGDHSTAYADEYRKLVGEYLPQFVHFEALLLMRNSAALRAFYREVKLDTRRKLFMGPAENQRGAALLGADFLQVPMRDLFAHVDEIKAELLRRDFDVLLWGAGMAGSIPVSEVALLYPERTYINLGSALDPLFRGRSRTTQLSRQAAVHFLAAVSR